MNNIKNYGPFQLWILNNFPFTIDDWDSVTQYQMLCKCLGALKEQLDVNSDLYKKITDLENYVNNYFENLDVQDEIDHKLDEMVEDGTLQEIITEYLQIKGLIITDTVESMKSLTNVINGSRVKTLGYRTINDGGSAIYQIRTVTNEDVENDMDIIALNDTSLVAEIIYNNDNINPKIFGAYGDNEHDDIIPIQFAIDKCIELGKELYFTGGTYILNTKLDVKVGKVNINGDKSVKLLFNNLAENISFQNGSSANIENITIVNDKGIAVNINNENINNSKIDNLNIDSKGYGILVNNNTDNGDNLKLVNNNIKAGADGIEINTTHYTDDKFKDIIIDNNIISTPLSYEPTNPTTAGFGVGIATGKNIVVSNNIFKENRREAIHIEGGSKHIAVCNNILANCELDGITVYADNTKNLEPIIITNNTIKSNGNNSNTSGIYYMNTTKGQLKQVNINNNLIDGFTYAFNNGNTMNQVINADGLIVKNCTQLINGGASKIKGNIIMDNTNKVGSFSTGRVNTLIESLSFNTELANDWLEVGTNNSVTIKELNYIKNTESATGSRNINLLKMPKYIKDMYLTISLSISNVLNANVTYLVNYDGTNLTSSKINENIIGAVSLGTLSISDGNLIVPLYSTNAIAPTLNISMYGDMLFNNY